MEAGNVSKMINLMPSSSPPFATQSTIFAIDWALPIMFEDRIYKLGSGLTSEYGYYGKSLGELRHGTAFAREPSREEAAGDGDECLVYSCNYLQRESPNDSNAAAGMGKLSITIRGR